MSESILKIKSFAFALRTVKLSRYLVQEKQEFVLSRQVLRSGTSIGANVEEANQRQSRKDFVHKIGNRVEGSDRNELLASTLARKRDIGKAAGRFAY